MISQYDLVLTLCLGLLQVLYLHYSFNNYNTITSSILQSEAQRI